MCAFCSVSHAGPTLSLHQNRNRRRAAQKVTHASTTDRVPDSPQKNHTATHSHHSRISKGGHSLVAQTKVQRFRVQLHSQNCDRLGLKQLYKVTVLSRRRCKQGLHNIHLNEQLSSTILGADSRLREYHTRITHRPQSRRVKPSFARLAPHNDLEVTPAQQGSVPRSCQAVA